MDELLLQRREFLKMLATLVPATAIDWDAFPFNHTRLAGTDEFDAIVIGSGLGGLSCAAAFARQGFKPLVIEQHDKPGGFATAFARPGGYVFDVSLHSTTVSQRDGHYNLLPGFPEITSVDFVQHPSLFRAIYPEHDISVPQKDPKAYVDKLSALFPDEQSGIAGLFEDMRGLAGDIGRFSAARGQVDMSRFPADFPVLFRLSGKTWGDMVDARLHNPKLKAIVSGQWGYYGLPPSKLSCYYYALPFLGYLTYGGFYPRGRSQDISNALARYIQEHGGKVLLNTRVSKILVKDQAATGVSTADGKEFKSRVVISNADPFSTFRTMVGDQQGLTEYESRWQEYSVSLSCFSVFLGLKEDLVKKLGITDSEIFISSGYDPEADYAAAVKGDMDNPGVGISLYDNIFSGYSPAGKNTISLLTLQGYGPWEKFERDYHAGKKEEYRREKERIASMLIQKAERSLLPGLSKAIEVQEIGTPLTVVRYTGAHRGAIYGWDQTVNNSGANRVGHATPIKNLYLAGAWSRPGHGYGAVIPSGLECFGEIMKTW
ncbi:MAG TPA: NAD(P)/FAD-dependent oxidoreductase [Bacteroidota bacterium]|nr:NAD(P)/FAD-dependent oxidoreductase [Bacteroidota bacterium]